MEHAPVVVAAVVVVVVVAAAAVRPSPVAAEYPGGRRSSWRILPDGLAKHASRRLAWSRG
jgi:hypothetical protein